MQNAVDSEAAGLFRKLGGNGGLPEVSQTTGLHSREKYHLESNHKKVPRYVLPLKKKSEKTVGGEHSVPGGLSMTCMRFNEVSLYA